MQKKRYLDGKFQNRSFRIQVECYNKTPGIRAALIPANGPAIPLTQNLGGIMPPYRCVLSDGIIGPDDGGFMRYMEKNRLGHIVAYKWFDRDVFTGKPRRVAAIFQFDADRLRSLDPEGCARYEKHNARLLRRRIRRPEKLAG